MPSLELPPIASATGTFIVRASASRRLFTDFLLPESRSALLVRMAWMVILSMLPLVAMADQWGWDLVPVRNALHSLNTGKDIYVSDIAAQESFRIRASRGVGAEAPMMYVYPPVTLPFLHACGTIHVRFRSALFLIACIFGSMLQIRAVTQAVLPMEARCFAYLAPVSLFFPGLLASSNLLSGNIAYILYGMMLLAAARGWRSQQSQGRWGLFYVAVIFASGFKTPYLTLLAIPILSSRREWVRAGLAALGGVALVAGEALVWPLRFAHYLRSLAAMFEWQHDFGSSPAGMLATSLIGRGQASSSSFLAFYLLYAIPLFALLFYLSRRYLDGAFTLEQWIPTLLVGVVLLNPRIIEYDVAPLTIPLALIGWRAFQDRRSPLQAVLGGAAFVAVNAFALLGWSDWKLAEGMLLVMFFGTGCVTLLRSDARASTSIDGDQDVEVLAAA